jgi:hypothetical protein
VLNSSEGKGGTEFAWSVCWFPGATFKGAKRLKGEKMTTRVGFALSLGIAAALLLTAVGVQAQSHIRIVRLSYIDGQVGMDRAGQGLERAILNSPIVEGTRLVTGSSGLAEVEFENRSSLRMTDNSEVKFRRLLMNDSGAKVNEIEVVHGIVYLDVEKSDDLYRVTTKDAGFLIRKGTELRLTAEDAKVQLAVFKGEVQVENQAQPLEVKKKQTATLTASSGTAPIVAPGVDSVSFDAWNNERAAYTSSYAQSYGGPVNGYGSQDLNYYGSYFYAPGYGYAWQPFGLMGVAGWNPYSAGAWMFNPGMGYSFASAYPWGWLPYHYGSWAYLPNAGWAWLPGSGSSYKGSGITTSFNAAPVITKAPAGFTPALPPASMTAQHQTILLGQAASGPVSIPGGRVPPNFRAVLPTTATRQSVTKAGTGSTFTPASSQVPVHSAMVHPVSGHVFAAPTMHINQNSDLGMWGPGTGRPAGQGGLSASMPSHSGASVGGHSGHTGGAAQH